MNLQEQLDDADAKIGQGDYTTAISLYEEIIKHSPDCDEAWLMLGSLYGETGQIDKSIEYVEKAVSINPGDSHAHQTLGHIKFATGDKSGAFDAMTKAAECSPDDIETLCAIADFYRQLGEINKAIELYEKATSHDDTLVDVWVSLGELQIQTNELGGAESSYNKAISLDALKSSAMVGLCCVLNNTGRTGEVLKLLDKIPEEVLSNTEVLYQLALAHSLEGLHAEALVFIDKAIAINALDKYVLGKADILQAKCDYEQAFELLKPYLELKPPNATAVVTLSNFCRIIDLDKECVQLLDKLIDSNTLQPHELNMVKQAKDWVITGNSIV